MTIPLLPMVVAVALFMENLDATILATALPTLAKDLETDPVHLKLALTSYLLALAVTVPASGWIADRFGAKLVFLFAIGLFTFASAMCGFSSSLEALVLWRTIQGVGGALMTPIGRLVVLRSVDRAGLVSALAWFTVPALLGPVLGPPVGGIVITIASWSWIFWINVPIGIAGILLAGWLVPPMPPVAVKKFDVLGFLLVAVGLALVVSAATLIGVGPFPWIYDIGLAAIGVVLLAAYVAHARRVAHPVLDLKLFRYKSFRSSVLAGLLFRTGVAAGPFLLPLLFQIGFGLDAVSSGLLTFASGAGALAMKFAAPPILRRFGFRSVLVLNGVAASLLTAAPALFGPATPSAVVYALLFIAGFSRSLQFTTLGALAYAEVEPAEISGATSISAVAQQVASSLGISCAALVLDLGRSLGPTRELTAGVFPLAFVMVALVALLSVALFRHLPATIAAELAGRTKDAK